MTECRGDEVRGTVAAERISPWGKRTLYKTQDALKEVKQSILQGSSLNLRKSLELSRLTRPLPS